MLRNKNEQIQTNPKHQNPCVTRAGKCTKLKIAGTEPMRQRIPGKKARIYHPNQQNQRTARGYHVLSAKKLKSPRLRGHRRESKDARAYTIEDRSNRYKDFITECNEEPTQDWQRRWNRHDPQTQRQTPRKPNTTTPMDQWKTESPDNYATLKRSLPESKTERIYIYDMDYRCYPWDEPTIYDTHKLSFKIQVSNPQAQPEETTKFPSPLSPILKKTAPSPTVPVVITSAPISAENIICIEDKTMSARKVRQQRENASSPSSPPQTSASHSNDRQPQKILPALPEDLNIIK